MTAGHRRRSGAEDAREIAVRAAGRTVPEAALRVAPDTEHVHLFGIGTRLLD